MRVNEICRTDVCFCTPDTSVIEAAKLMRDWHVGDIVVVDGPAELRPVGIVTDRDIVVELIARDVPLDRVTVSDIMSHSLVCVDGAKDAYDTLALMRHKGIRRMPIVDADDKLIGIVTLDDLLQTIAEELGLAAKLIAHEREQETHARPSQTVAVR